jgi:glutathione S-transferase
MDDTDEVLAQQIPAALRQLAPSSLATSLPQLQAIQAAQNYQAHQAHHSQQALLASQLQSHDLTDLDSTDPNSLQQRIQAEIGDHNHQIASNAFEQHHNPTQYPQLNHQNNGLPQTPQHNQNGGGTGQFGILTPQLTQLSNGGHHAALDRLQHEEDMFHTPDNSGKKNGHIQIEQLHPNPPRLAEWREKLFDVDEMLTLTNEE